MDERAQAIETLYRERYGRFRDGVATITGDYEAARDVVQEASRGHYGTVVISEAKARSKPGSGGSSCGPPANTSAGREGT